MDFYFICVVYYNGLDFIWKSILLRLAWNGFVTHSETFQRGYKPLRTEKMVMESKGRISIKDGKKICFAVDAKDLLKESEKIAKKLIELKSL